MDLQREELPWTRRRVDDACDERKCISLPLEDKEKPDLTYCYGGGRRQLPMMCTDGFVPVVVDDEPLMDDYQYFTCCPPSTDQDSKDVTRHCSDPIVGGDTDDIAYACESRDDARRYPRKLEAMEFSSEDIQAVICCDSNVANTMNFLDQVECVPYKDDSYLYAMVLKNSIGKISGMECNVGGGFVHPRPIDDNNNDSPLIDVGSGRNFRAYQCCKNGPAVHYRKDSAFNITVYPVFVLFCLSAVVSLVVATALLVPLVIHLKKNGSYHHQRSSRIGGGRNSSTRTSFCSERDTSYSTYNLYLVALVVVDFMYSLLQIGIYGSAINQRFNLRYHGGFADSELDVEGMNVGRVDITVGMTYVVANLWINAIVAYQVLDLLRNSQQCQRIHQLSRSKAIRQIGVIYVVSGALGAVNYFLYKASYYATTTAQKNAFRYPSMILYFLMVVSPLVYVAYVAILIKCRGYMRSLDGSSATNKVSRTLSIYFGRIIAIFYGIWLPGMIMLSMTEPGNMEHLSYLRTVTFCLYAIQPLLTTCVILTKSDVRKYVWDLVSLAYLRKTDETRPGGISSKTDETRPGGSSSMNHSNIKSGLFKDGSNASVPFGDAAVVGPTGVDREANTTIDPHGAIPVNPTSYEQNENSNSNGSDDERNGGSTSSGSFSPSE